MQDEIKKSIKESIQLKEKILQGLVPQIEAAANLLIQTLKNGHKILIFGNGGSAADSQHIAAELVGRYKKNRGGLPAIALTANTSNLTAIANDFGYEEVFSRQIEALGKKGDAVIGITTSGTSKNVIKGIKIAKTIGLKSVALSGCNKSELDELSDVCITVPSSDTPHVQEAHITIGHILCDQIEKRIFP